jgi:hypothetical protein
MAVELVEWTMGRHLLHLLAYLAVAGQVRGLEPVEQELQQAIEAVLPLYRTPAEEANFRRLLASVLHAYRAAGMRMAEAVASEQTSHELSERVVRLPGAVLERLIHLAQAAGDLEATLYLEAAH